MINFSSYISFFKIVKSIFFLVSPVSHPFHMQLMEGADMGEILDK